jgi:hypothetical protein
MSGGAGGDQEDAILVEVAKSIQGIIRSSALDRTVAIGALVIERVFGGSIASWRARRNLRNNSIRRLAQRPECPLSRSSLNQSVGIYAVTVEVPGIVGLPWVGASHIGVVLPLKREDQESWLRRASAARWSVRELREAVRNDRRDRGERRGRPKLSDARRALTETRAIVERLAESVERLLSLEIAAHQAAYQRDLQDLDERLAILRDRISTLGRPEPARRDSKTRHVYIDSASVTVPPDESTVQVDSGDAEIDRDVGIAS